MALREFIYFFPSGKEICMIYRRLQDTIRRTLLSLYNMLHGTDPFAPFVLSLLNLQTSAFGRFRDAGLDQDRLYVLARVGGGNAPDYPEVFEAIQTHPLYLADEDDDFDSTFRYFYFRYPVRGEITGAPWNDYSPEELDRLFANLEHAKQHPPKLSLREKTEQALAALGTPPTP